jgi:hypothetical protein
MPDQEKEQACAYLLHDGVLLILGLCKLLQVFLVKIVDLVLLLPFSPLLHQCFHLHRKELDIKG